MLGEVTVKGVGEQRSAARRPTAEVEPSEYKFDVTGLKAGENTLTFANKGNQFHHLIAVPMTDGATLDDVKPPSSERGARRPAADRLRARSRTSRSPAPARRRSCTLTFDTGLLRLPLLHQRQDRRPPHFTKGMVQQVDIA